MNDPETFRAMLAAATADVPRTSTGIPLIDATKLDLKDAQIAPLIILLADVIEAACVQLSVVPMMHANAA
jgi:hypothetical protein